MDYRIRGVPGPVLRRARARAARDSDHPEQALRDVVIDALRVYGDETEHAIQRAGGLARAERLSPERRREIARHAARVRHHPDHVEGS